MCCVVLVIVILSVRLSVRLSVTLVEHDCVHMVRPTIIVSSPYGSPMILVFRDISGSSRNLKGVDHPSEGIELGLGGYELAIFDLLAAVSPKWCKTQQRILLITNRKSNTHFQLVAKSTTLVDPEMTWDGNYALCYITLVFRSQPLKFE